MTSSSMPAAVVYGVQQGSFLEPILFLLYTADLLLLIKRHHLKPLGYADDTQIYEYCQLVVSHSRLFLSTLCSHWSQH